MKTLLYLRMLMVIGISLDFILFCLTPSASTPGCRAHNEGLRRLLPHRVRESARPPRPRAVTSARSNTIPSLLPFICAFNSSRCSDCTWPISRIVVCCPSESFSIFNVIFDSCDLRLYCRDGLRSDGVVLRQPRRACRLVRQAVRMAVP